MNAVRCPHCNYHLPPELHNAGAAWPCPRCREKLEVLVFPAIHRQIGRGAVAELAVAEGETTCFFHPDKKAAVVCNGCGRFLCALCDVPVAGEHLCPKCVETGRNKNTLTTFENYRKIYPTIALSLALFPLVTFIFWWLTLVTAPAAIFVVIYGWRKPASVTGRKRRWMSILALVLAILECGGWVVGFFGIYHSITHG